MDNPTETGAMFKTESIVELTNDEAAAIPDISMLQKQLAIASGDDIKDYGELTTIGIGGMGAVFEADDPGLQRKVALKILRSNYRNRMSSVKNFVREARITARIDHPNIVSVHHLGVLNEIGVYFTMKRIHGETMREIFNRIAAGSSKAKEHYTMRRMLDILIAGCNGVAAAHAHGILHCDLKPANLMVGRFGEVLVLDWGVAREKLPPGPVRPGEKITHVNSQEVEGTPVFMPPELLCGEQDYPDEQTDVYGLGVILYSILAQGGFPFDISRGKEKLIEQVVAAQVIPIDAHLPKGSRRYRELEAICAKAMEPDRLKRYNNVEALRQDIYNYLDGFPVSACFPNIFDRFFKLIRRRPLIPSVLLAIALSWSSYYGFSTLLKLANDEAMYKIIDDNRHQANSNRKLTLRRFDMLRQKLSPLERTTLQQNMLNSAINATVEYNLVFDAASRLNPKNREEFLRSGGAGAFRRLLTMHRTLDNQAMIRQTLNRCNSEWRKLFDMARIIDPELNELVKYLQTKL